MATIKLPNDKNIVKKSKSGHDYISPCELSRGSRSYSQAMLMKISHNDKTKIDLSLKIGRYNIRNGKPIEDKPKSELTLKNDELNSLIEYISNNYKPLILGQGEYINVNSNNAELINQFKAILDNSEETAKLLVENEILTKDVNLAVDAINKNNSLEEFKVNLDKEQPESFWQNWFENNKWILGSDFVKIVDERKIDTENIADYLMQSFDGFVDIVEIKKPNNMSFWSSTKDHNNYVPSSDLTKAITQCLNYIYAVEQEANSVKFIERVGCKVIKPRCTLVYGRSNDWDDEKKEAFRILNSAYNQLSIITYDQLLERAKNILNIDNNHEDETSEEELPF